MIYFVRHGQSTANAGGLTMAHAEIPLSPLGELQAQAVADELLAHRPALPTHIRPPTVLVSSMRRTQQTARPFCSQLGLSPVVHPGLDEFSVIDPALIAGLRGDQRKPFVKAYWDEANPHRRLGDQADTFLEFEGRVRDVLVEDFEADLCTDAADAVVFGHGIWLAMLIWQMLGYRSTDADGMRAFRRFQQSLPMPNCAVYSLVNVANLVKQPASHPTLPRWSVKAETAMMERVARIEAEVDALG